MPMMVNVERRIASPFVTANSEPSTAPTPYADTMIPYRPAPASKMFRAIGSASCTIATPNTAHAAAASVASTMTRRARR